MLIHDLRRSITNFAANINNNNNKEWLVPHCEGMVWRLELCGVTDALDADALWDQVSGSGRNITEVHSGRAELRLRRALEDYQVVQHQASEFGKWVQHVKCFNNVILCIPGTVWDRDELTSKGKGIKVLTHNLRWRHIQDFKKDIPTGRVPNYLVRKMPELAGDRVIFMFGFGVYLPVHSDTPIFQVLPELDNTPLAPLVLKFAENPEQDSWTEQPVGFYADQERMIFTPEGQGPLPIPGWKASDGTFIGINRTGEDTWQAFSDNQGITQEWPSKEGGWIFERKPISGLNGQVIRLELARTARGTETIDIGSTLIPDAIAPASPYSINFEAILLPLLLKEPKLLEWTLWLHPAGILANADLIQRDPKSLIRLRLNQRGLWLLIPNQQEKYLGARITKTIDIADTGAQLLPFFGKDQLGMLRFSCPTSYSVGQQSLILGRTNFDNYNTGQPDKIAADITLDQLEQPNGLLWGSAYSNSRWTIANLSLSRQHASLRVEEDKLFIQAVNGHSTLRCLDQNLSPLPSPLDPTTEMQLEPEHVLLAGFAVLRFRIQQPEMPKQQEDVEVANVSNIANDEIIENIEIIPEVVPTATARPDVPEVKNIPNVPAVPKLTAVTDVPEVTSYTADIINIDDYIGAYIEDDNSEKDDINGNIDANIEAYLGAYIGDDISGADNSFDNNIDAYMDAYIDAY